MCMTAEEQCAYASELKKNKRTSLEGICWKEYEESWRERIGRDYQEQIKKIGLFS